MTHSVGSTKVKWHWEQGKKYPPNP